MPTTIPIAISTEERQARTRPQRAASLVTVTVGLSVGRNKNGCDTVTANRPLRGRAHVRFALWTRPGFKD